MTGIGSVRSVKPLVGAEAMSHTFGAQPLLENHVRCRRQAVERAKPITEAAIVAAVPRVAVAGDPVRREEICHAAINVRGTEQCASHSACSFVMYHVTGESQAVEREKAPR